MIPPLPVPTKNPLNVAALPPSEGFELDYIIAPHSRRLNTRLTVWLFSAFAIEAAVFVLLLRLTAPHLVNTLALAVLTGLSAISAIQAHRAQHPPALCLLWLIAGPTIWGLMAFLRPSDPIRIYIGFGVALLVASALAIPFLVHYGMLRRAHPALDRPAREWWIRSLVTAITIRRVRSRVRAARRARPAAPPPEPWPDIECREQHRVRLGFLVIPTVYLLGLAV